MHTKQSVRKQRGCGAFLLCLCLPMLVALFGIAACGPYVSFSPPATPPASPVPQTQTQTPSVATAGTTPTFARTRTYHVVVNANQDVPGVDTGMDVATGEHLAIQSEGWGVYGYEGEASCSGYVMTNPDGGRKVGGNVCAPKMSKENTNASAPVGELLATIVPTGGGTPTASSSWFAVGSNYSAPVTTGGRLWLLYNDASGTYTDNKGSYQVTITVSQ